MPKKEILTSDELFTLLMCSKINFENLVSHNPSVATHPMYMLAKRQLDEVLEALNK